MNTTRQNTLDIRLPEGVVFSLPLAGPSTRFVAWLVDCLLTYTVIFMSMLFLSAYFQALGEIGSFLRIAIWFLVPILYGIVLEGCWRGQTVGKRLLGLRVMDAAGLRLNWQQVFIRNILRGVDALPIFYLAGGSVCLFSQRAQRMGDLAADTVVVRNLPAPEVDLSQLTAGKYNTLRDHPVIAARLRQRIPPLEAGLALQAIMRRNTLEPAARVALFAEIAERFRAAVPLPEELIEDVTDEQHVRNTVDVLYRARASQAKV